MIPDLYIEQWRANAPWLTLAMVEQDLILSRVLIVLYNNPKIANTLAFRGGTALNKLFIQPPARYSEDLDFVQIKAGPIGDTIDAIRSVLDSWLGEPKRKLTKRSAKLVYRYSAIDNTTTRLKIEINTTEHFQVEPLQKYSYSITSDWCSDKASVVSYTIDELMATKLRALYQRRKGRDLFDLWYVLDKGLVNPLKVVSIFEKYCEYNKEIITRAMFEQNLFLKKQNHDFQSEILSLLTTDTSWDFSTSLKLVEKNFIEKLKGESWRG